MGPPTPRPALRVTVDGLDVAVYREGKGPDAFLMPVAWGLSAPFLIDAMGPARKYLTVHSFDPPGVGASGPGEATDAPARDAARLASRVMHTLGLDDVTLVAPSSGGFAALDLLASDASSVARAVLIGAYAHGAVPRYEAVEAEEAEMLAAFRDAWKRAARSGSTDDASALFGTLPGAFASQDGGARLVLEELLKRERPESVAARLPAAVREARATDHRPRLKNVGVPTWVVVGRHDALAPVAMSEEVARGIPGARLSRYSDASHFPFFEKAAVFHRHLREFAHGRGAPRSASRVGERPT